jgi:predicted ATPase/DNA-binding CsgD family transcriptional regulator
MIQQPIVCPILIERRQEMAALQTCLARAASGQGQLVLLTGEAGIGKSRLVLDIERLAAEGGFQVLAGRCFSTDHAWPFAPLADLLRDFLSRYAPADGVTLHSLLGPSVRALLPLLPEPIRYLPEVATLPTLPALDPEQEKRRIFTAFLDFLTQQASPLLLVVEDLHWCDESSLEFLLLLAQQIAWRSPAHPLLLLATYRSEEIHPPLRHWLSQLQRARVHQEIALAPLSRAGSGVMLQATLSTTPAVSTTPHDTLPLPPGLLDALYEVTEGNPFFLEEALKAQIVSEALVQTPDGWHWNRRTQSSDQRRQVPVSLRDGIELRLERVSPGARRVARIAAVAGRRFDFLLLQQITLYGEQSLVELLRELVNAQLVVEESMEQFAFRHPLTQHAIAAGLLARERRSLHRLIAVTLERLTATGSDPQLQPHSQARLADLAYHFTEAELWPQAMRYAQQAAEQAQALDAPRAVVEQWMRAIRAAQALGQTPTPQAFQARGQGWERLGDFEQARADYEQALETAEQMSDERAAMQSLLELGTLWTGSDYDRAGVYFRQAMELARRLDEPVLQARSLNRQANWLLNTGQVGEALATHHQALALFEKAQDQAGMAETLDLLGTLYGLGGDAITAVELYSRAIELLRTLGNRTVLSSCLAMRTVFAGPWSGHTNCTVNWSLDQCERDAREALQLAQDAQWRSGEAFAEQVYGGTCVSFGRLGVGLAHLQQGVRIAMEINHQQWIVLGHEALARAYLTLLDADTALRHAQAALAAAQELGSAVWNFSIADVFVQAYMLKGRPEQAEATTRELLPADAIAAIESENPQMLPQRELVLILAELTLMQGRPATALQWCERLLATAPQQAGAQPAYVIPRLSLCQGEALAALGKRGAASEALEEARRGVRLQGYLPLSWQIDRSLGRVYRRLRRLNEAREAFAAARQDIAYLAANIDDVRLREQFERAALASLPREKPPTARQVTARQFSGLTERERDVVVQIGQGKSNAEIAATLVVTRRTVETYVSQILSKLGLKSRAQIALWARDRGLDHSLTAREP